MLTRMTDEDWATVLEVFRAVRSRRGDKGRDDRLGWCVLAWINGYHATGLKAFRTWLPRVSNCFRPDEDAAGKPCEIRLGSVMRSHKRG